MGAFLDGQTVLDPQGNVHKLADSWAGGPVWLTFIRHFG